MDSHSACLRGLSTELQLAVIECLDPVALRNWSSTCSSYRALLAPYIFKVITLRNTERSALSVDAVANSRYVTYVEGLHYIATAPGDSGNDNDEGVGVLSEEGESVPSEKGESVPNTIPVFPGIVHKVLSNLESFLSLHTLSIDFAFDFEVIDWNEESAEPINEAEETEGWRAVMAKTFAALLENTYLCIKALEIRQLPSTEVSTFRTDRFHDFLGTLERFDLSIHGSENAAGWNINTLDRYLAFVSKLDEFFFDHLNCVTHFSFRADETGPIGLEGRNHARLALSPQQMPRLQYLNLEHIFICEELVDFLTAHADTLEIISMRDCYANIGGLEENGIYWEQLFTALYNAKPRALGQVHILPIDLPIEDEDAGADAERESCRRTRSLLEQDKRRRLFAYAMLNDKYGTLYDDEEQNVNSFLEGRDQKAYDDLMQVVHEIQATFVSRSLA
ncbi:MAG: hypothetical protein Q9217_004348 [Psora testacea]